MPIIKVPNPLPSALDYVPPQGDPYQVKTGESWYSLAERKEVMDASMTANDLCYFNFRTRYPPEINWYLYNKVGCRMVTSNGKNYMFSSTDKPGVVYLPKIGPKPPVTDLPPRKPEERSDAWIGLVGKGGTMFFLVGNETIAGYVVSLDDIGKGMAISASVYRLGGGFGADGGLSFILITGMSGPAELNGYQQMDGDFNLALGENWGKLGKSLSKVKKLEPIIKVLVKTGAKTPGALKKLLAAEPDRWMELVKAARAVKEKGELGEKKGPNVMMFDVPFAGLGTEASLFYGLATYTALWDCTD